MMDIERSFNDQITSQLQVPVKVLRTKIDRGYTFELQIKQILKGVLLLLS